MIDVSEWNWVVNKDDMTCKNVENQVVIKMEKDSGNLRGMLHDMPMKLFAAISKNEDGEKIIEKIVKMAEAEYLNSINPV